MTKKYVLLKQLETFFFEIKNTSHIRIQSIIMAKTICQIQHKRKNGDKDEKALHKLMNDAVYGKTMKNLRNRINVKLLSNEKGYMK